MLSSLFLASLISGLLLGVYSMLNGVERQPTKQRADPARASTPLFSVPPAPPQAQLQISPPTVAASAFMFGLVGYLLLRYTTFGPGVTIVLAAVAAGLGLAGMLALVTRWAIPGAAAESIDARYLLQGTPARVTRSISPSQDGEVDYAVDGVRYATTARSFDGSSLPVGAEVAIDRIEDGVAYVEDWELVEQRL